MWELTNPLPAFFLMGVLALAGYYVGTTMKYLRLPSIIGYMLVGVAVGPHGLFRLIRETQLDAWGFLSEMALGFVAFTIGAELSLKALRQLGKGIVTIIFAESFGAFFAVLLGIYLVTRDPAMALIFAAMAPASAPAGTVAVIQEYRAKGTLTTSLYAVVGFDDGLAILIFGFAAALAKAILSHRTGGAALSGAAVWIGPSLEILLSLTVGTALGFLFSFLVRKLKNPKDAFILVVAVIFLGIGLSGLWHLSLILTDLVVGFVFANVRKEALVREVGQQLIGVMPLLFLLFFALAGAQLNPVLLPALGLTGLVYILGRTTGLMGGAYLGALLSGAEDKIRRYLGLGILSQAGVAIGLALIVKSEFAALGPEATRLGSAIITSVTATCVFFEIIGPITTKIALSKAGEIPEEVSSTP
ncbi:MAG: cation:proton antiporter [Planctomycetota bacterium]